MKQIYLAGVLASIAALYGVTAAHATSYTYASFDAPAPSLGIVASSINNSGEVTGYYVEPTPFGGVYHAYVANADGSSFLNTDRPGYIGTGASGINNAGTTVGVSVLPTMYAAGFERTSTGAYTTLDPNAGGLQSYYSEAIGVNDVGDVVGFFDPTIPVSDPQLVAHGYLENGGVYTQLDVPAAWGFGTEAFSIDNGGVITGGYLDGMTGAPEGFIYTPGSGYAQLALPGGGPGEPGSVNTEGDYVAASIFPDPSNLIGEGFLSYVHTADGFTPFAVPDAKYTDTYGINDIGQISGVYISADNSIHGFTTSPAPEPGTWTMLLLGFGLVGATVRQKTRVTVRA